MMYYPKEEIDIQLLKSVPNKIFAWVTFLGTKGRNISSYHGLHWEFNEDGGYVELVNDLEVNHVSWQGPLTKPDVIGGGLFWMEVPSKYLELFIEFEKQVYDRMEKLHEEILDEELEERNERDLQAFKATDI